MHHVPLPQIQVIQITPDERYRPHVGKSELCWIEYEINTERIVKLVCMADLAGWAMITFKQKQIYLFFAKHKTIKFSCHTSLGDIKKRAEEVLKETIMPFIDLN